MASNATGILNPPADYDAGPWSAWVPALNGQTDNAVATYTTQLGRFTLIGSTVFFKFVLVTSGTTTKTTLTDNVQINLPLPAATNTGEITRCSGYLQNATPITVANAFEIASGASLGTFLTYEAAATNGRTVTWAATLPGIGGLTTVISLRAAGFYEI